MVRLIGTRPVPVLLGIAFLITQHLAFAQADTTLPRVDDSDPFYSVEPADIDCVLVAAQRQGVPGNVLLAIASVENGKNGQVVANTNGTFDIGHFQINTMHCDKGEVAAWMLRQNLDERNGQDYWTRAANYHSRTPRFNSIYRKRLIQFAASWARWLERTYGDRVTISQQ